MHPRGLLCPFPGFVLNIVQKSKNTLAFSLLKLQRSWEICGLTLQRMTSSLVRRRLLSWRKSRKRVLQHARLKGNLMQKQ